jgi:hypothetical protein
MSLPLVRQQRPEHALTRADVRFLTCRLAEERPVSVLQTHFTRGCTGSGPGPEVVLSSRPSGRVCRVCESAELRAGGVGEVVQTRIQMETGVAGQARSLSALGSGRLLQASILAYPPPDARPCSPTQRQSPSGPERCGAVCGAQCAVCTLARPGQPPTLQPGVQDSRWQPVAQWSQILSQRREWPSGPASILGHDGGGALPSK